MAHKANLHPEYSLEKMVPKRPETKTKPKRKEEKQKRKKRVLIKMRASASSPRLAVQSVLSASLLGRSDFVAKKIDAISINIVHIVLHILINISAVAPPHRL